MDETRYESLVRNAFFQGLCLKPVQVVFGYSDVDSLVFIRGIASVGLILLLELFELFDRSPFILFIGTKDIFFAVIVLLRHHFFLSDSVSCLSCPECGDEADYAFAFREDRGLLAFRLVFPVDSFLEEYFQKRMIVTLVFEMGLSYALMAPLLGVSASAVCRIIKTAAAADGKS